MEINSDSSTAPTPRQFMDLLQRFIRLRPNLILPDHVVRFKQQVIESLKDSKMGGVEDYHFIIHIFILLAYRQTPPTMGELSADLNTPFSTATRIVDWLVQGHFVERFSDHADRRIVRVRMTETGQQFYQTFLDDNEQRVAQLLKNFSSDEKLQLLQLMNKLLDSLLADMGN